MKRWIVVVGMLIMASVVTYAQGDTTLKDLEESSIRIRRKPNGEWLFGVQRATQTQVLMFQEQPIEGTERDEGFTFFGLGVGGHIPLAEVGALTTIWLVPAGSIWFNVTDQTTADQWGNTYSVTATSLDVSVPIHATIGYGALRRKNIAWGIEGGLGFNAAWRSRSTWQTGYFTFTPSAMIDVSYAPKNVYRLRFMADLISAPLESGVSYQTWTFQFVIGM